MENTPKKNLRELLRGAQTQKFLYSREVKVVARIKSDIAEVVGDMDVYISEFILAKIKGKISGNKGHPEITDEIILNISVTINNPLIVYFDKRVTTRKKYLFIENNPPHQIVVEVQRRESGKTEINTIIPLGKRTLKQLEVNKNLQAVFSKPIEEAATLPSSFSQQGLSGVKGDGSMIEEDKG